LDVVDLLDLLRLEVRKSELFGSGFSQFGYEDEKSKILTRLNLPKA